jgi:malonyl-CoA/methylmalonyl-CoA synthetase
VSPSESTQAESTQAESTRADPTLPDPVGRSVSGWSRHLGRFVQPAQLYERLTEGTLHTAAHATALAEPGARAVRIGGESLTHGSLDLRARSLATWLAAHGAGPGNRVALVEGNSLDYVVSYLGILHSGAAVVLVNPMLTERELAVVVEDSDPVASICAAERTEQMRALGVGCVLETRDLDEAITVSSPAEVREPEPESVAHLAFTSGTTGRPKPTPLTHANVLSSMRSVIWSWRISAEDHVLHALPLQHAHGLSGLHATLLTGCRSTFMTGFDPVALCREVEGTRASVLFAVPAMWERLVESSEVELARLGHLRLATSGSAPLSPATSDAVHDLIGLRPLERYGLTETGFVLSNPYEDERRPGSVGFPLPGAEVGVSDGHWVADGQVGEIVLRGPSVFSGYLGTEVGDTFDATFDRGWFRTGDLGRVDLEDGYVYIVGRSKEMILTGGLNVYPREIELVLESLPGVSQAAVVGVPSRRWGEEVTAFLVPVAGARIEVDQVSAAASIQLAAYKRPKSYRVVDDLPRNHMGKIVRSALLELAAGVVGPEARPR